MNGISQLWDDATSYLKGNALLFGITSAEKAKSGKVNQTVPPSCVTWVEIPHADLAADGTIIEVEVNLYVFCIAAPDKTSENAVNNALDIAAKIITALPSALDPMRYALYPNADNPIEIVDPSSTSAIVAAVFTAKVAL